MGYDIIVGRGESDKKTFGDKGLVYLGKGYVKMGQYTSLSNKIYMDVARSHVVLVAGKRGSGKSYTLGVLAEELSNLPKEVSQNIGSLIFDTMGIYWTMKYTNEKDKELLRDWDLQAKNLPVKIFVPYGHFDSYLEKGIPADRKFALDVMDLNPEDWIITFGLDIIHPVSVLIERSITKLKLKGNFGIDEILEEIKKDKTSSQDTINAGVTSVLDLSVYNAVGAFNVRALVISLVCRKIFNQRMSSRKDEEVKAIAKGLDFTSSLEKKETPLVWLFIDEAHEFLPKDDKTVATDALVQLLREGRQPGVSLVLATQQPGQIHRDVMTQSDIVISHRVTSFPDLEALNHIMQSYLLEGIQQYMDDLPTLKGSAIILDDNSERIYPVRIKPRFTWHGGEAPTAVEKKKEL